MRTPLGSLTDPRTWLSLVGGLAIICENVLLEPALEGAIAPLFHSRTRNAFFEISFVLTVGLLMEIDRFWFRREPFHVLPFLCRVLLYLGISALVCLIEVGSIGR
jgi:hypothetical protein